MLSGRNTHPSPGIGKRQREDKNRKGQRFIGVYFSFLFLFGKNREGKRGLAPWLVVRFVIIECMKSGEYTKKKSDSAYVTLRPLPSVDLE